MRTDLDRNPAEPTDNCPPPDDLPDTDVFDITAMWCVLGVVD